MCGQAKEGGRDGKEDGEADGEADEKESEIEEKILPYNRSVALPKIVENSCPIFFDQNSYASVDQKYFSPPPEAK